MLVCYALALKEGFADYAEPVVKLMVPMLKFYFHDGVRTAAAQSLPCLLDCAKVKGTFYNFLFTVIFSLRRENWPLVKGSQHNLSNIIISLLSNNYYYSNYYCDIIIFNIFVQILALNMRIKFKIHSFIYSLKPRVFFFYALPS